jgi:hypothetical protein
MTMGWQDALLSYGLDSVIPGLGTAYSTYQQSRETRADARAARAMSRYYERVAEIQRRDAENRQQAAAMEAQVERNNRRLEASEERLATRRRRSLIEGRYAKSGVIGTIGTPAAVQSEQAATDETASFNRDLASDYRARIAAWRGDADATNMRNQAADTDYKADALRLQSRTLLRQSSDMRTMSLIGGGVSVAGAVLPMIAPMAGALGPALSGAGRVAQGVQPVTTAAMQSTAGQSPSAGAPDLSAINQGIGLIGSIGKKRPTPSQSTLLGPAPGSSIRSGFGKGGNFTFPGGF